MTLLDKLYEKHKIPTHRLKDGQNKTKCPECQPKHDPSDDPLSVVVHPDKILFHCHHCDWSGGVLEESGSSYANGTPKPPPPSPVSYTSQPNAFLDKFFKGRGISRKTYEAFDVFTDDNLWINFPYNGHRGKCDAVKSRMAEDKQFKQNKNPKKSLYNYKNVKDADTVVFVEGEMDALSVAEAGFLNVTTLQDGAPSRVTYKESDKRFHVLQTHPLKAKKIILFLDQDEAGNNLRLELAHRFGKDKCWRVMLPEGFKDANEYLVKKGALALKQAIEGARPYPVEGLHRAKGYHSEVMNLYKGNYDKPLCIGYPSLDDIYKVMKGTFHVVTGIPNHGKSTFLDQCLIQLAKTHDWKFAVFSPEHSTKMHIRRLAIIYTGKAFDPNVHGRMTEEELSNAVDWIHEHFFFVETREHTPNLSRILESARGAVQKFGCNGMVIDPYNEVDASRKGSLREDEHIRNFISECKRFCKMMDVTMWVVAHPTKMSKNESGGYSPPSAYDIAGASHWSNMSDAILTIHRDFDSGSIRVITRKVREQGLYGRIGEAVFYYDESKHKFIDSSTMGSSREWREVR